MFAKSALAAALGFVLSGCVAPEEPARPVRPAQATSAPPPANLEQAPIPNRRLRGPSDSVIRIEQ